MPVSIACKAGTNGKTRASKPGPRLEVQHVRLELMVEPGLLYQDQG